MNDKIDSTVINKEIIYCEQCNQYTDGYQYTGGAYCYECGHTTFYENNATIDKKIIIKRI